jgi:hypothetical protein
VRKHYIGERFDVGHLLERRKPNALGRESSHPAPDGSESVTSSIGTMRLPELPDLSSQQISTTELVVGPPPPDYDDDPFATLDETP